MARAYSLDLREKVIDFVLQGNSKAATSRLFGINVNTVASYMRLHFAGDLSPGKANGNPSKVCASEVLKALEEQPDIYLRELGEKFGLSEGGMSKFLSRLGITRKKKRAVITSATRKRGKNIWQSWRRFPRKIEST